MRREAKTGEWLLGMALASIFSLVYLLTPVYFLVAITCLLWRFPSEHISYLISAPLVISALFTKASHAPRLVGMMKPMLHYFEYEEEFECSNEELRKLVDESNKKNERGRKFIVASQPHGVISFCGICAAINSPSDIRMVKTAAASALLHIPILKNVMGIFGLVDASSENLKKHFQKKGIDGTIVIYIGGIAELFKSSRKEERLYLSKRKGFIKIALREGVDIIPAYLFGNTSVLTVVKSGPLARLSRRLQTSLTYFWGKWGLPIPRDDKLLYVRGRPMGLPHIRNPTEDDINEWHTKYCTEVNRLFEKYKEKLPMYKNKTLFID